jgi:hypothetical protein
MVLASVTGASVEWLCAVGEALATWFALCDSGVFVRAELTISTAATNSNVTPPINNQLFFM